MTTGLRIFVASLTAVTRASRLVCEAPTNVSASSACEFREARHLFFSKAFLYVILRGEKDAAEGIHPAFSTGPGRAHRAFAPLLNWSSVGRFYSRAELMEQRVRWKQSGDRVVFTNGCYDLLHPGHIRLLEQARSLGDVLILALNSDASVRRLKGPSRPLLSEQERAEVAAGLAAVDAITVFDEDTPRELIAAVLPDILVKGADWAHWIAGREEVEAAGGQVLALALEPGYSTTGIVEEILTRTP